MCVPTLNYIFLVVQVELSFIFANITKVTNTFTIILLHSNKFATLTLNLLILNEEQMLKKYVFNISACNSILYFRYGVVKQVKGQTQFSRSTYATYLAMLVKQRIFLPQYLHYYSLFIGTSPNVSPSFRSCDHPPRVRMDRLDQHRPTHSRRRRSGDLLQDTTAAQLLRGSRHD